MQQLESIHKGMTGGTYKVDNSSSIAEVRKICTTFGNDVAPTSDANNLGRRLQVMLTRSPDKERGSFVALFLDCCERHGKTMRRSECFE